MGSWAMSIHVRTEDVDAVIEAARAYLLTEYRPSERVPEPGSNLRIGGPLRALQVSEARNGWVSVLDSELMGAPVLSMELAERLGCHTLMVGVSDSDTWDYHLCRGEELIDAFNSKIDEASAEAILDEIQADLEAAGLEGMDDLAELFEDMGPAGLEERLFDYARQMQERLLEEAPPDLRAIEERLQRGGSVSPEEIERYNAWVNEHIPYAMGDPYELLDQLFGGDAENEPTIDEALSWADEEAWEEFEADELPSETPHSDEELADHAAQLRPLLAPGVTEEQVVAVLRTQSVLAEDDLRRFLPLLGIPAIYADLSYHYAEEFTPEELAAEGVRLVAHLTFERIEEGGDSAPGLRMI